jgi:hypothetical protein
LLIKEQITNKYYNFSIWFFFNLIEFHDLKLWMIFILKKFTLEILL